MAVILGFLVYFGQQLLLWEIMGGAVEPRVAVVTQSLLLCGALLVALLWRTLSGRSRRKHAVLAARDAVESALCAERDHLARELHDTVGHGLTMISLSARRSGLDRPHADLRLIDDTAHNTMQELSRVLRRLSLGAGIDSGADVRRRQLALAIGAAVDAVRPLGLSVRLTMHRAELDLLEPVCRTAERVVRESLLNIMKHMPDAEATVSVTVGRNIELSVCGRRRPDRGRRPNRPRLTSSGQGVQGLKEQLRMYGGSLSLAVGADFSLVRARIPLVLYSESGAARVPTEPCLDQSHAEPCLDQSHGGNCHAVGVG